MTEDAEVERVARAISDSNAPKMGDWERQPEGWQNRCRNQARAAIAALRPVGDEKPEPDEDLSAYEQGFHGHGRGLVITQPESGKFVERPMTVGELAARHPARLIATDIHKLATYAAFAYVKVWEIIAPAIDRAIGASSPGWDAEWTDEMEDAAADAFLKGWPWFKAIWDKIEKDEGQKMYLPPEPLRAAFDAAMRVRSHAAPSPTEGWRFDMENAPKNVRVLVWGPDSGVLAWTGDDCWPDDVTCWQPLPAAPSPATEKE